MVEGCLKYSQDEIGVLTPLDVGLSPSKVCVRRLLSSPVMLLAVILWLKLGATLGEDLW